MICAARRTATWKTGEEMLDSREIHAALSVVPDAFGLVVQCYAQPASRLAAPQKEIAQSLAKVGIARCTAELLDPEEAEDPVALHDIGLFTERMHALLDVLATRSDTRRLPLAVLAADDSVPAALGVAQSRAAQVATLVACYGRPDFAPIELSSITVPTLLLVPSKEAELVQSNQRAFEAFNCPSQLAVIVGASLAFSEPGTLVACGYVVQQWCERLLRSVARSPKARC